MFHLDQRTFNANFTVLAALTLTEVRAYNTLLKALTILLLTARLSTIAAPEVPLGVIVLCLSFFIQHLLKNNLALSQHICLLDDFLLAL